MRDLFSMDPIGAAALLAVVVAATSGSCAPPASAGTNLARVPAAARTHRCAGVHGSSRVMRSTEEDGGETLRGDTEIPARPGSTGRLHLSETAHLGARGQLLHARVVAARPSAPVTSFVLEPRHGAVRIMRDGAATVHWRVPADAPWIYQTVAGDDALLASTPLAAWVALRAARAGPIVRVLVPERQQSYLVPIDQIAVATEKGTTVVLAGDGIDTDDDFVTEVRLADRWVTLTCADLALDVAR